MLPSKELQEVWAEHLRRIVTRGQQLYGAYINEQGVNGSWKGLDGMHAFHWFHANLRQLFPQHDMMLSGDEKQRIERDSRLMLDSHVLEPQLKAQYCELAKPAKFTIFIGRIDNQMRLVWLDGTWTDWIKPPGIQYWIQLNYEHGRSPWHAGPRKD